MYAEYKLKRQSVSFVNNCSTFSKKKIYGSFCNAEYTLSRWSSFFHCEINGCEKNTNKFVLIKFIYTRIQPDFECIILNIWIFK